MKTSWSYIKTCSEGIVIRQYLRNIYLINHNTEDLIENIVSKRIETSPNSKAQLIFPNTSKFASHNYVARKLLFNFELRNFFETWVTVLNLSQYSINIPLKPGIFILHLINQKLMIMLHRRYVKGMWNNSRKNCSRSKQFHIILNIWKNC